MRTKLKETREKRGLNQQQLADCLSEKGHGVRRQTVSEWETLDKTIRTCFIEPLRDILDCQDPDLFDVDKPASTEKIWDIIIMLRRHFIEKLGAALGLAPYFQNMTVALVSSPQVETDEYLSVCRVAVNNWWNEYYLPNNAAMEVSLQRTLPVLRRLATTVHPYQAEAARLAVEVNIIYTRLLTGKMMDSENEINCRKALEYAAITEDKNLIGLAYFWLGDHYTYNTTQPETAIKHLGDALKSVSHIDGNPLLKSAIYSDLSIAHAQNKDPLQVRENERNSLVFMEKAHASMPGMPEIDAYHNFVGTGLSELEQFDGRALLFLAELTQSKQYALKASTQFKKALNMPIASNGYRIQALTRLGDSARALDEKSFCVECLTSAYQGASSLSRYSQIHDVLKRVPNSWKPDKNVKELFGAVTDSIVKVRNTVTL